MEQLVRTKFESYPKAISRLLGNIRTHILSVANEIGIEKLEETLKWGEPSYLAKGGSTIRFGRKNRSPDQYRICFNCNTKLIETFKERLRQYFYI